MNENLSQLAVQLYEADAVKFGSYVLKSGITSPLYVDLRVTVSYPDVLRRISALLWKKIEDVDIKFDIICGVPYTALPFATCIAISENVPMVLCRKEAKSYGTKRMVEGSFRAGQKCLVIEDVVTTGSSVLEVAGVLKSVGLEVTDAIVLLDREHGGYSNLLKHGIQLHSVLTLRNVLCYLHQAKKVDESVVKSVETFLNLHANVNIPRLLKSDKLLSYGEREQICTHPVSKRLLSIMNKKETNLCVAIDVTNCATLLNLARAIGPHICILKTHIDILDDYSPELITELANIAEKENFIILEDRKFSDIGHTVQMQYKGGYYNISKWADLVTVHALPGPGIFKALKEASENQSRASLIVAEMSSKGTLTSKEYSEACVQMAEGNLNFIIGFISQSKLSFNPLLLHMTPGVKIDCGGDSLGQQYTTPEIAIKERGADVIIVGRGITGASDPAKAAKLYKEIGFKIYRQMLAAEKE